MLRAYAVGWDAKYHQGCLLALMDPLQRDNLGIISISRDGLAKSLSGLARAMAVIAKEISSPSMKGETDFFLVPPDENKPAIPLLANIVVAPLNLLLALLF